MFLPTLKVAFVCHYEATGRSIFTKLAGTTLIGPTTLRLLPPLYKHFLLALQEMDSVVDKRLRLDEGQSHLAADGGDLPAAGPRTLIHGGERSLVVHLQQLQSPGAVAHLDGTGVWMGYIKLWQIHFIYDENKVLKLLPLGSLG